MFKAAQFRENDTIKLYGLMLLLCLWIHKLV